LKIIEKSFSYIAFGYQNGETHAMVVNGKA
jgi:hypothetical protein